MSRLAAFVGDQAITKFSDFCLLDEEGVSIVLACYIGVEEGVDMWFPKNSDRFNTKFRLNIKVGNNEKQTTFLLRDGVAMMVAWDTCNTLISLGDGTSLYPNELDDLTGEVILYKVNKIRKEGFDTGMTYDVEDVFADPCLIDMWLDANEGVYGRAAGEVVDEELKRWLKRRYREPLAIDDGMEPLPRLMYGNVDDDE